MDDKRKSFWYTIIALLGMMFFIMQVLPPKQAGELISVLLFALVLWKLYDKKKVEKFYKNH